MNGPPIRFKWASNLLARFTSGWRRQRLRLARRRELVGYRLSGWARRHAGKIELAVWITLLVVGNLLLPSLVSGIALLIDHDGAEAIRSLIATVGGAMIGATAIAASFILFALQVNVERLPHGLFRWFSSDKRLLASVAASLLLAVGGTALSLISADSRIALAILLSIFALALILRLLFYAYRRSLLLVSPIEQLRLLHDGLIRKLDTWSRRVDAWAELVELPDEEAEPGRRENRLDMRRLTVLQNNPDWHRGIKAAVGQATAYARRAGEGGDLEISAFALTVIAGLNAAYIRAKGRTFFSNQLLFDNPLVTDGVVNETLEGLKRLRVVALTRGDELQLEQIFNTLAHLTLVYGTIEYGSPAHSKSHALLAAGYLEHAVEAVVPSGLTDTLMRGVQAMGTAAKGFLATSRPQESVGLINKIGAIGAVGAVVPAHKPVTLTAMEQLRDITVNLLRMQEQDPGFALRQMRDAVSRLAEFLLQSPDKLMGGHEAYLAPYYGATSNEALHSQLGRIANALVECVEDDALARQIVDNIEVWADGLFDSSKKLLLLTVEKQSPFFFHVAHWITSVAEILLVVAAAPAARQHSREELRKHARWMIGILSWIPTDKDAAQFVEGWSHLDNLTEFAMKARRHGGDECADAAERIMLDWGVRAGVNHTGWGTLGSWLTALAALTAARGDAAAMDALKKRITAKLRADGAPDQDMRQRAAHDLRETADEVREREYEIDLVQHLLARGDRLTTRTLLNDLAAILSEEEAPGDLDHTAS